MKSIYQILLLQFVITIGANAQCFDADESIWQDPWASCAASPNPKAEYGSSHWIQYDFGEVRTLSKSWVWNINDPIRLNQGFNQVKVDYSDDAVNWTYWGEMTFPMAQGEAIYSGFPGPDLFGVSARYVLLTAISNHGHSSCSGLTEIKFNLYPELIEGEYNDSVLVCDEGFEEGVNVYEITYNSAFFTWYFDVGPGLEFVFEYRKTDEAEWLPIEGIEEPEFLLEFLEPGTTYEYRVVANCNGELVPSGSNTFTTPEDELNCERVENIWLVEATENTAEIAWEEAGEDEYYYIRYDKVSSPYLEEEADSETTEFFFEDLEPFTEYKVRIAVLCEGDDEEEEALSYSEEFRFVTGTTHTDETLLNNNAMRLYPNPTPGRFSLEYRSEASDLLHYSILDLTGKVLQQNTFRVGLGTNLHEVNLSGLPDGIYLVNTRSEASGAMIKEKIIKIRP
ncbi:MAG: fibronectin type III domain-containing protein [Mameliella sp.]|nr:fibronectin type III domain-containing protein [Phaeodactylibacter sp.]